MVRLLNSIRRRILSSVIRRVSDQSIEQVLADDCEDRLIDALLSRKPGRRAEYFLNRLMENENGEIESEDLVKLASLLRRHDIGVIGTSIFNRKEDLRNIQQILHRWPIFIGGFSAYHSYDSDRNPWIPRSFPSKDHDSRFREICERLTEEKRCLLDWNRLYTIWQALYAVRGLDGASLEVGVYRGGTTAFIARCNEVLSASPAPQFAIDTFEGHRENDISERDLKAHSAGTFSDVVFEEVREYVSKSGDVNLLKCAFSEAWPDISSYSWRFVHLDVDLYAPTLEALKILAEKILVGGIIIIDDFGGSKTPGIVDAVTEFFSQEEKFIVLTAFSEQAVAIKIRE